MRVRIAILALALVLGACDQSDLDRVALCGDGVTDSHEQCDDGNERGGDGCSPTCLSEFGDAPLCGNAVIEPGEDCDDGNMVSGDGCDLECRAEQEIDCGNGVRERDEECDDGNLRPGDGCAATCTVESGTRSCVPRKKIGCGERIAGDTSVGDAVSANSGYACNNWNQAGPEHAYLFAADRDGEVRIDLQTGHELDLYVLAADDVGCDAEACLAAGDEQVRLPTDRGHRYLIVVDGYLGASGSYALTTACEPTPPRPEVPRSAER